MRRPEHVYPIWRKGDQKKNHVLWVLVCFRQLEFQKRIDLQHVVLTVKDTTSSCNRSPFLSFSFMVKPPMSCVGKGRMHTRTEKRIELVWSHVYRKFVCSAGYKKYIAPEGMTGTERANFVQICCKMHHFTFQVYQSAQQFRNPKRSKISALWKVQDIYIYIIYVYIYIYYR